MSRGWYLRAFLFCLSIHSFTSRASVDSSTDSVQRELDRRLTLLKKVAVKVANGSTPRDCSRRNFIRLHDRPYGTTTFAVI